MKKNGFTLAEVLITLAIIGVVATMTLPALMTNTGEQQAKTGLKKALNTLTEAAKLHEALSGYDFGNLNKGENAINVIDAEQEQSIEALLRMRTTIDYPTTQDGTVNPLGDGKFATAGTNVHTGGVDRFVSFKDGIVLMYKDADVYDTNSKKMEEDGLPAGFMITIDTNGPKGPNVLANCNSQGANKGGADDNAETADACIASKNARFIGDRFQLRVRGSVIEPVGAATSWALQN